MQLHFRGDEGTVIILSAGVTPYFIKRYGVKKEWPIINELNHLTEPGTYEAIDIFWVGTQWGKFSTLSRTTAFRIAKHWHLTTYSRDLGFFEKLTAIGEKSMNSLNGYTIVDPNDEYEIRGGDLYNITRQRTVRKNDGWRGDMWVPRGYQGAK